MIGWQLFKITHVQLTHNHNQHLIVLKSEYFAIRPPSKMCCVFTFSEQNIKELKCDGPKQWFATMQNRRASSVNHLLSFHVDYSHR